MASITAIPRIHPFIIMMKISMVLRSMPTLFLLSPMKMAVFGIAVTATIATAMKTALIPSKGFIAMVRLFITVRTVGIRAVAIVQLSTLRPQRMASITVIPRIHPFIIKMNFWPMVLLSIKLRPTLFQNLPMTMAVIGRRAVETTIATATIATHAMTAAHLAMAPVSLTAIRA